MSIAAPPHGECECELALASPGWLDTLDAGFRRLVEVPAALLVAAEVLILFVGICARTFHRPIIWSDELASILFLWLAMFGAVVALLRGEHMRLTFLVSGLSPRVRAWTETLAVGAMFMLFALMLHSAYDYTEDQSFVEMPALGWSGVVRAAAVLVGFVLALLACCIKLARHRPVDVAAVAALLGAIALGLYLAAPLLVTAGNWSLMVFFVGLLGAGVLAGVPIAFSFALATAAYLLTTTSTPLTIVVGRMDEGMSGLILLAIPLFVLLGQLVEVTGMARVMVAFLASLLGHVKAGMSYVLLGAMLLVSGISGSKTADMAAVAPVLFPEMRRRGMKDGELLSLLAASGAMSETIPPSIVLIAIASVTGVSIAALFTAGIMPALVLALVLAVVARWRAGREEDQTVVARAPMSIVVKSLAIALPALLLPFLIRTAVVEGFATATEVSTIGIAYSLVLGILVYRGGLRWRAAIPMLARTASLSGAILFIVGAASAMSWALTQSGFSHALAAAMAAVPGGQTGFLLVSVVAFMVLGSLLEGIPAIVLFGPLLFPIAKQFGVHEVHYSMVVILAMGLGLFAPPFGLCYYAACIIGQVAPEAGMRRIWIYLGSLFVGLLFLTFVPWFSIGFLPGK
ncbi:ABC transporter permease [Alsobacter metallidurans]|uniref:ABC transporter permease n=1 Tax=Alsobacter metallidurans TaxID=340221 RepID=A0A917MI30_9HYPH|nr:TRAP transporter large permease subunit [Alsobacter metallidurans]GGH24057.1 ABC transporter permease [Alsobacter metallidurans]